MTAAFAPLDSSPRSVSRWQVAAGAAVIGAAALAAYHNSFSVPFIFDDVPAIVKNSTIRHLGSIGTVLWPPHNGDTVGGRPMVNLSLAINFALSGTDVWSYHALNLVIHLLAGLTLFGVARRTLERGFGLSPSSPLPLALALALLWTLHPLQTESVTYIVQRAESLMGLFYFLTLYCFIRGVERVVPNALVRPATSSGALGTTRSTSGGDALWFSLSILACLLGMASKEVMVTAPVIVLLYDRTFVGGSFSAAWRWRRGFYIGLAATWILLAVLMITSGGSRGGTVGFNIGVAWWAYALTQFKAIVYYLRASFWPNPLVFDYGTYWVKTAGEILPFALVVLPLLAGTAVALWRRPLLGFAGFWFFVILSPTSSVVPGLTEMIVEHRMYLPLAGVIAFVAVAGDVAVGRRGSRAFVSVLFVLAGVCGVLTERRNRVYRSNAALWSDTTAKRPANAQAQYILGTVLVSAGRPAEAIAGFAAAVKLLPGFVQAQSEMADCLVGLGRISEAIPHYQAAVECEPDFVHARNGLGLALAYFGRNNEAIAQDKEVLKLNPDYYESENNLGNALRAEGRLDEAIVHYRRVLEERPELFWVRDNLGLCLTAAGRLPEAVAEYEDVLRQKADNPTTHFHLGVALAAEGRSGEAMSHYREAVRLDPAYAEAHYNLGEALAGTGQLEAAIAEDEAAVRLKPDFAEAQDNLGAALANAGRMVEAIPHFEAAVRLDPGSVRARTNLQAARHLVDAISKKAQGTR